MKCKALRKTLTIFASVTLVAHTATAATYLDCLLDFERHAETIWRDATGTGRPPDSGYFGDGNSSGNGGIRGSCGVALSYAVLVHSLPGDPKNATRLARIRQAINYAANTHVSGANTCIDNKKWGHNWQTSLWAGSMGLACLLVQSDLPAGTVEACQRAIADEATYRAGVPPASGYIGDTKAEENAWNGNVVALAAAWLNTHSNAPLWLDSAKRYLVNTYTVADTSGDPLASWITTTTLYPSFAVENHGFYHPLYQMVSGMSMGDSLLMARLADPNVAVELQPFAEHNVLNVWNHLRHTMLDSSEFAYPSGLDWAMHTFQQNSYYAWLAHHFNDPLARWADSKLVQLLRYRQIVNGDGTFLDGTEANAFYMEAVIARRAAIAWLHHTYAVYTNGPTATPGDFVEHFADIKLIMQRGPGGFVSISYGPKIMGLIEPPAPDVPTNAFVTSPRLPGIIGLGALGNPTSAQLVSFTTNAGGFDAQLTLQHGSQGATEVFVKSTGETVAIVEVPYPAAGVLATAAGSFNVGIENDPLTGGSRLLEWTGGSAVVTNRSGVTRNVTNDWVCVAGRYGIAAGPAGYFRYQAPSSYNRLGAAQDTLQFMAQDPLAPRYAVWFPGQNAAQTMTGANSISWSVSTSNAVLTFPGPGGAPQQIVAALPPPPGPYQPYAVPAATVTASSTQPAYPPAYAVDGNETTFWVSGGSSPGQGPTIENPEWLQFTFPRLVGVSEFRIYPRTFNGGYGPKAIEMILDGVPVYAGTMAPTAALGVRLPQPVPATNALLLITSSYDPSYPANSRNVQVVEVNFFERALPGTFGDWALRQFSDAQLADPATGSPTADPEQDDAVNLLEFAMGGEPLFGDAANFQLQSTPSPAAQFAFRFRERKQLEDVVRQFEESLDLVFWTEAVPLSVNAVQDLGEIALLEVLFPLQNTARFFRLHYRIE